MAEATRNLIDRYRELPRAYRWLLWLAVVVVVYLLLVERELNQIRQLSTSADVRHAQIREYGETLTYIGEHVNRGRQLWGRPEFVQGEQGVLRLNEAISGVLREHGVSARSLRNKPMSEVKAAGNASQPRSKFLRAPIEVQFSASPDVVTSIVAELERQPLVARIASLNLSRRTDGPRLDVTLVAEAWVIEGGS